MMPNSIEIPHLTDTQKSYDAMRNNLISVNTGLNTVQEGIKEQENRIAHLEVIVLNGDGNKQLSHSERIRVLESYIDGVRDTIKYWGRLIGGALILNFLGFMAGIIVAIIKFLPVLEKIAKLP